MLSGSVCAIRVRAKAGSWLPAASWLPALRLAGPAFVISIGYVDPGNWATDLAAGTFGFRLLWVVAMANVIAIVLQLAVARLTIASGDDLASMMSARWPRLRLLFWATGQSASIATDLAEFTGIVLGIQLLFHYSRGLSVALGALAVLALLGLGRRTSRGFAFAMFVVMAAISLAYVYQIHLLQPSFLAVAKGAIIPQIPTPAAITIVVGIIGATVMPHNLFLHSALIAQSCRDAGPEERAKRGSFFTKETLVALNIAALINGGILVVGAALHSNGSIEAAFHGLDPLVGPLAATLFAAALLLSGLGASATATLSGDYVFNALAPFHIPTTTRRLLTIAPAALALLAGANMTTLLIGSQMALAFILPLVVVPLLLLARQARLFPGSPISHRFLAAAVGVAVLTIGFDVVMLAQTMSG